MEDLHRFLPQPQLITDLRVLYSRKRLSPTSAFRINTLGPAFPEKERKACQEAVVVVEEAEVVEGLEAGADLDPVTSPQWVLRSPISKTFRERPQLCTQYANQRVFVPVIRLMGWRP